MLVKMVFFVIAFTAFAGALLLVFHAKRIVAALGMVLATLSIGVLFIGLHVPFLGFFEIIIYAGAVMVMVIYIVMAVGLREDGPEAGKVQAPLAYLSAFAFILYIYMVLRRSNVGAFPWVDKTFGSIASFGNLLVSRYAVPFELASLLLVGAMVGAIVLSRRHWT